MKTIKAALAAALLCAAPMALSACATAPNVRDNATKAMLAAEATFNTAATAEEAAKASGLLAGDNAAKADAIRHQAYAALLAMRVAYKAGQAPDATQLITLANDLLAAAGKPPLAATH